MELLDILETDMDDIELSMPHLSEDYSNFGVFPENICTEKFNIEKTKICERGGLLWICKKPTIVVLWKSAKISIYPWNPYMNAVSFQFSGCIMAAFKWKGKDYIAHIQRGETDCMADWIDFIKNDRKDISNLVMFRPDAEAWNRERQILKLPRDRDVYLWGLITPERHCYSVCVCDSKCGGVISKGKHESFRNGVPDYYDGRKYSLVFLIRHYAGVFVDNYKKLLESPDEESWKSFFMNMQKCSVVSPRTDILRIT